MQHNFMPWLSMKVTSDIRTKIARVDVTKVLTRGLISSKALYENVVLIFKLLARLIMMGWLIVA